MHHRGKLFLFQLHSVPRVDPNTVCPGMDWPRVDPITGHTAVDWPMADPNIVCPGVDWPRVHPITGHRAVDWPMVDPNIVRPVVDWSRVDPITDRVDWLLIWQTHPSSALKTKTSHIWCRRSVSVNASIPTHDSMYISTVVSLETHQQIQIH